MWVLKGGWRWRECDPALEMGGLSGTANSAPILDQKLVQWRYSIRADFWYLGTPAICIIMATGSDSHIELVYTYEEGSN